MFSAIFFLFTFFLAPLSTLTPFSTLLTDFLQLRDGCVGGRDFRGNDLLRDHGARVRNGKGRCRWGRWP